MEIIDFYYFAVVYCNPWMFSESDISGDVAVKNKTNTGSHFVSTPTYTEKKNSLKTFSDWKQETLWQTD